MGDWALLQCFTNTLSSLKATLHNVTFGPIQNPLVDSLNNLLSTALEQFMKMLRDFKYLKKPLTNVILKEVANKGGSIVQLLAFLLPHPLAQS